jgi:hypothetical protein
MYLKLACGNFPFEGEDEVAERAKKLLPTLEAEKAVKEAGEKWMIRD